MDLILENVSIGLGKTMLVRPLSLTIAAGDIVTLMGPSGSGKSSLLAHIAGDLQAPLTGSGRIRLGQRDLVDLPPEARRIGRMFQDDLLFPHLTVGENLLFGIARGPRAGRLARMREALVDAGLGGFEDRAPHALSGGQRSRVSLFRSLLARPDAMLLDEPFAKLDMDLRQSMRAFVFSHLQDRAIPSLIVTHDPADSPSQGRVLLIGSRGEVRDA